MFSDKKMERLHSKSADTRESWVIHLPQAMLPSLTGTDVEEPQDEFLRIE